MIKRLGGTIVVCIGILLVLSVVLLSSTTAEAMAWRTVREYGLLPSLNAIAYGAGQYVAVGESGYIINSNDGEHWAVQGVSGTENELHAITWSGTQFVIVGDNSNDPVEGSYAGTALILTSPDGITWTRRESPSLAPLNDVTYSSDLGLYLAVGDYGVFLVSENAVTWTFVTASFNQPGGDPLLRGAAWGSGRFVVVGEGRFEMDKQPFICEFFMTSPDGLNWTEPPYIQNADYTLNSVAYSQPLGMFVAVGEIDEGPPGGTGLIYYSANGMDWAMASQIPGCGLLDVAWGSGKFVAVGSGPGTDHVIMTSTDGIAWGSAKSGAHYFNGVSWKNPFYAVGHGGIIMSTAAVETDDGDDSTPETLPKTGGSSLFLLVFAAGAGLSGAFLLQRKRP